MDQADDMIPEVSVEEYLELEGRSDLRHEYVSARIFALGGGSREHNRISLNLAGALNAHLRGGPCEAFMADMKVRVYAAQDDAFYYPDVVVACDPADRDRFFVTNPSAIVEVLSPGTERIDRREKYFAYRQFPSLDAYVLVAQHAKRVEIYRRSSGWQVEIIEGEGQLDLPSLKFSITLADLYAGAERPKAD